MPFPPKADPLLAEKINYFMSKKGGLITKGVYKKSTKENQLVSVITIVFNGEQYLEQTIQSVLSQTYDNIEYIIIDGGSTDGTLDIIKKNDDIIDYWICEKDKGISDAFNKGIDASTGDIIGIINAGDWYELTAIEKVVKNINKTDIIYGNLQYWDDNNKNYVVYANHKLLYMEMTVNHPTVFVNKTIYDKHGKFNASYKYAMDYELLLRFFSKNVKFSYLNETLTNMRLKGLSDINWIDAFMEGKRAKNIYLGHKVLNYLWFIKQVIMLFLSRTLNKIGLSETVKFYRHYLSPIIFRHSL